MLSAIRILDANLLLHSSFMSTNNNKGPKIEPCVTFRERLFLRM